MLLETMEEIKAARDQLPAGTMVTAADLISMALTEDSNAWPQDRDEATALVGRALIGAKTQRLGRELSGDEIREVLREAVPYAERILIVGLSGALWQLRAADRMKTGLKWAGRAALVGVGALLGIGLG